MTVSFQEEITLSLPNIGKEIHEFNIQEAKAEDKTNGKKKLVAQLAAIHEGVTANFRHYSADALEKSLESWVKPYPKPILLHHDVHVDPLGRVMASQMSTSESGKKYVQLQTAITDPAAIEKILDKRYITGSVGGSAGHANCSICEYDWSSESSNASDANCRHKRGKMYAGELCYWKMSDIVFDEYSFVNVPADSSSSVMSHELTESAEENYIELTKVFAICMDKVSVVEFKEGEDDIDILKDLKKKDANYIYTNLKGTWLASSAYAEYDDDESHISISNKNIHSEKEEDTISHESDDNTKDSNTHKETEMPTATENDILENEIVEEDILDVAEGILADAAETVETVSEEESDVEADAEAEEVSGEPEGQENEVVPEEEVITPEEEVIVADETENGDSHADDTDESSEIDANLIEQLQAENAKLVEVNAKLKTIMHKMIAEKVVDKKITLGITQVSERNEAIEEHSTRSVSSLRDSLKDLSTFVPAESKVDFNATRKPEIVKTAGENVVESTVQEQPKKKSAEAFFTDVFMARTKL